MTFFLVISGDVSAFDQHAFRQNLASTLDGIDAQHITLNVSAASIRIAVSIVTPTLAIGEAAAAAIEAFTPATMSQALGITVEELSLPAIVVAAFEALSPPPPSTETLEALVLSGALSTGALLLLCISASCWRRRRRPRKPQQTQDRLSSSEEAMAPGRGRTPSAVGTTRSTGGSMPSGRRQAADAHDESDLEGRATPHRPAAWVWRVENLKSAFPRIDEASIWAALAASDGHGGKARELLMQKSNRSRARFMQKSNRSQGRQPMEHWAAAAAQTAVSPTAAALATGFRCALAAPPPPDDPRLPMPAPLPPPPIGPASTQAAASIGVGAVGLVLGEEAPRNVPTVSYRPFGHRRLASERSSGVVRLPGALQDAVSADQAAAAPHSQHTPPRRHHVESPGAAPPSMEAALPAPPSLPVEHDGIGGAQEAGPSSPGAREQSPVMWL